MTSLPGLRPVVAADAAELLRLVEACDIADDGEPDYTIEDVEDDLSREGWHGWVVERAGRFVAHAWVERRDNRATVHADVRLLPDADAAIAPPLLALARKEAARLEPGGVVHVPASVNAHRARRWLTDAGGSVVRHYWRMVIDIDRPPAAPPVPAGVTLEQPADDVDELRVLHHVIDTAFLDEFGSVPTQFETWLQRQRTSPGADLGLWWLARVAGVPAAVLIGRAWPDTGWVQGVGTLPELRGRGLARLLLLTAFGEFYRRGQPKVSLGVDAANPTGALALYESVGMRRALEVQLFELAPLTP
jgi:GNAT superfamily N-acetyltransferase